MSEQLPEVEIELDVPFFDLDPLDMVWFGNYYKYFDRARSKLMELIEYGSEEMKASGYYWPVIESRCRHSRPLEFNDRVRINAEVDEYQHRLKVYYVAWNADSGNRVARGYTVQVAVDIETGEMHLESPKVLYEKLGVPYEPEEA